jgi:hypothetical protein
MNTPRTSPSSRSAVLFLAAAAWIFLSLGAGRETSGAVPALWTDLVRLAVDAIVLFLGFYFLSRAWVTDLRPLSSVGFVRRPGAATEFGVGAAVGWGIAVALVLPAVLTGNLSLTFSADPTALSRTVVSVAVLVCFALLMQLVLAGLPTRLLHRAIGARWTMVAVIFVAVVLALTGQQGQGSSLLFTGLAAALFCMGYLRTRAIWVPLGLQIGWTVGLALLFGANSPYTPPTYGIVQSDTGGSAWLTGGPFGPEASLFAIVVLIAALFALHRVTRDYAWHYTYQPILGAGQAVEIAPPAEHVREEKRVAAAAPLVQIAGIAPAPPATLPDERHDPLP